jgi:hypothetical protein
MGFLLCVTALQFVFTVLIFTSHTGIFLRLWAASFLVYDIASLIRMGGN